MPRVRSAPGRASGPLIRTRREARGWSQADLSRRSGLPETYIARVERGVVGTPRRVTLEKFGQALGMRVPGFYQDVGVPDPLATPQLDTFGTWLRRMIAARRFSTEREFASHIEVGPDALVALLNGAATRPLYKTLWRIAGALNVADSRGSGSNASRNRGQCLHRPAFRPGNA